MCYGQMIMSFDNPAYPDEVIIPNFKPRETLCSWFSGKRAYECTGVYGGKEEKSIFFNKLDESQFKMLISMAKHAGQECVCVDLDGRNEWYLLYVNGPNEGKAVPSTKYLPGTSLEAIGNPKDYTVIHHPPYDFCVPGQKLEDLGNPTNYTVIHYPHFDFYIRIEFDFSKLEMLDFSQL